MSIVKIRRVAAIGGGLILVAIVLYGFVTWGSEPAGQSWRIAVTASGESRLIVDIATCSQRVKSIEIGSGSDVGARAVVKATWLGSAIPFIQFDIERPSSSWEITANALSRGSLTAPVWIRVNYRHHHDVAVFPRLPNVGEALTAASNDPRMGHVRSVDADGIVHLLTSTC